jgi:hypothetical protein
MQSSAPQLTNKPRPTPKAAAKKSDHQSQVVELDQQPTVHIEKPQDQRIEEQSERIKTLEA